MSDLPESLNRARAQAFSRPAWEGVQNQRPPRPLPRQMRPPAQRANDPRLAQSERDRALRQFDRSNTANVDTYQRQSFGQTNQLDQFRRDLSESTGAPSLARSGLALNDWRRRAGTPEGAQDLADAAVNFGTGSLGVLSMAGMAPRMPVRGALRPPTEIAPNGMPIAPQRPFRNSLRGGSGDLMDAAGMQPDAPASRPAALPAGGALSNPPRFEPQPMGPRPGVVDRGADSVGGRPWTNDDIARAQEMRNSGATTRAIGEALGRSPGDVSRRLSGGLAPARPQGFDPRLSPDEGYAAQRSLDGLTPTQIAEEMDLPVGQVRVALSSARRKAPDLNIPLGRRQPSELTQRVTALKAQGLNRAQIAERLNVTPAQVNSALISAHQTRRSAANVAQPPRTEGIYSQSPGSVPTPLQRRFMAAVRDPQTGEVYTGLDHMEAIESAPNDVVRSRLEMIYNAPNEDASSVGFLVDGNFMSRSDGLAALRANRGGMASNFPTRAYHATTSPVEGPLRDGFGALGRGVYHSPDPKIAELMLLEDPSEPFPPGANVVMEMLPPMDRYVPMAQMQDDLLSLARERGLDPETARFDSLQEELANRYRARGFVGIYDPEYAGVGQTVTWGAENRRSPWK